jgi:hypothetical protein
MNNGTKNALLKLSRKAFAGGAKIKPIDSSLKEFDVIFLGKLIN